LLARVTVEEGFVEIASQEFQRLLLKVGRLSDRLVALRRDEVARLARIEGLPEELVDGVKIDWHREDAAGGHRFYAIGERPYSQTRSLSVLKMCGP
jgi:hypothetical protein